MNRRFDLDDINLLLQVVEHGSFTAAARATGIPKSTISQRIVQLEAAVGTGLLRRSSRSFSLTDAGAQLLPHARAIEGIARRIDDMFTDRDGELRGTLRISCSLAIAQCALSLVAPRFLADHAQVTIQIEPSNQLVDIIGGGFDLTVRGHIGPLKDSSMIRRLVAHTQWAWAASPSWLRSHAAPGQPEDVAGLAALCFTNMPDWRVWSFRRKGEERRIEISPRLIADDMLSLRTSAIAGAGIVHLPGYILGPAISSGELVRLLPDWDGPSGMISVLTPPKSQSSRLAAAFVSFLAAELPAAIRLDAGRSGPDRGGPGLERPP